MYVKYLFMMLVKYLFITRLSSDSYHLSFLITRLSENNSRFMKNTHLNFKIHHFVIRCFVNVKSRLIQATFLLNH